MANFSEMRSDLTERLHPRVDSINHDSRKPHVSGLRHLPEPQPSAQFVDRGRRFQLSHRNHDPIADTQLHHMQPKETAILNSSLHTTRFHHGFMRNHDAQRTFYSRSEESREALSAREARHIEHSKAVYVSRRPDLQGSLDCVNFKAEPQQIAPLTPRSDARKLRLQHEAQSPFDPPPMLATLRHVSERRKDLVAREGLSLQTKKFGVGGVFGTGDGFVLPGGALPPIVTPRPAKKIVRRDF